MADAPVRGTLAMHYLRALNMNRIDNLRISFEANIDSGLMLWAELERYPLFGMINGLSGTWIHPWPLPLLRTTSVLHLMAKD
jgi:hypothetical protein